MLRFCGKKFVKPAGLKIDMAGEQIYFDKNVWRNSHRHFRDHFCDDVTVMHLLPVMDGRGELLCYGWQDDEADRELRMLRELRQCGDMLQFTDIFPQTKEVVVYGCNELAYCFVKYLETQRIKVVVVGKYWNFLGYESADTDELASQNAMLIYAESLLQNSGWYQRIVRSASEGFECINKIYEANVRTGRIRNAGGGFEWLLEQLRNREVAVVGTGAKAQDVCDLLYEHGIDAAAFVDKVGYGTGRDDRTLLGKMVFGTGYAISHMKEAIFISCGRGSALGSGQMEIFDYYGYERNKQFFQIDDYTDVPYTNLIHMLKGKSVLLAGDRMLCHILKNYLDKVEEHHINVKYIKLGQDNVDSEEILCIVHPWSGTEDVAHNLRLYRLRNEMELAGNVSYTRYFSYARAFVMINEYLSRNTEKYTVRRLIPKGILLGAIPPVSGNTFIRGILDGHPNVMMLPYSDWNENLFLYCICLVQEKKENILKIFKSIIDDFVIDADHIFYAWDKFEENMRDLLALKEQFTSQELFVIFHSAYAGMINGMKMAEISEMVIYWEPHYLNRMDFPFLAKWLESPCVSGHTLILRRDGIACSGSGYKICKQSNRTYNQPVFVDGIDLDYIVSDTVSDRVVCHYWKELKMRFEDLKIHPNKELSRICQTIGISLSNTMLHTTLNGNGWGWNGTKDFDLKPVLNKYEEYFSEFDRFRISIICSPYQKKYGYIYENCLEFTRMELWEMFLKEFRFQLELQFMDETEKAGYFLSVYKILREKLWNARKHMLLDDIVPEFGSVEISTGEK